MEEHHRPFDVCIVCALPEEARAFLEVMRQQCEGAIEERISSLHHYGYRFATIKNDKDESLNLHISWLPRYGPQEMTLHLSHVLEECQPRIAIMTGICAGDGQHVQLGDLVVAERTFTYDNGKFTLDEHGRSVYQHDTMTYQLDANILQFLGLFDDWKPLVAHLKRPPSPPEQRKRHKIACHIKAMASGSAVRTDNPFADVQAPVRGTVAIDMEGAAFGLVMSRHPLTRWLVVKGVCDYADRTKNDTHHDYAARASAVYALSFIRAYVTNERLPRLDGPSPSSRSGPSGVWNVPYTRNPHFTGREELLDRLDQQLASTGQADPMTTRRAALTQPQAINGLGGIGKTQIAVEYAYRARDHDRYTHTLWVNAATEEMIITSFLATAELLPSFSAKNETDQHKLLEAIKQWLERCEQRWLLIFDNADDLPTIHEYLPRTGRGSILLTTRAHAVGSLAASIEVEKIGLMEGAEFLLHRAHRLEHASDEERNEATNIVIALDFLPLALDQVGAYIEETGCSFADYLQVYQVHRKDLLARRGLQATNYPDSVATTWSLSFQKVERANPAAAELLRLCAFLESDSIPEDLISKGSAYLGSVLHRAARDVFTLNKAIEELHKFSLVQRHSETKMLHMHRLVQAVLKDAMQRRTRRQWAERAVRATSAVFPEKVDMETWPRCRRYLPQAQSCTSLIQDYALTFHEAASLLRRTADYLQEHALYGLAGALYHQALPIQIKAQGSHHPDVAKSLNNLALLYSKQGNFAQAEPLYQQALHILESALGSDHSQVASVLIGLANLYQEQENFAQAELLYQRALRILEPVLGSDSPQVGYALNGLANLYYKWERYEEAELLYQQVLRIWEQTLGSDHPNMAHLLHNRAFIYYKQGKYPNAEELYQQALRIEEQVFGPDHPNVAYPLGGLANLYREQGKDKQAELLYQRALRIREQTLEPQHPETAGTFYDFAEFREVQGKSQEAEFFYRRALAIREQVLGLAHPKTSATRERLRTVLHALSKTESAALEAAQSESAKME